MNAILLNLAFTVVPHRELLVNIVRLRVRQLVAGHRPLVAVPPGMGLADVALSEIADGKLTSQSNTVDQSAATATAAIIAFPGAAALKKKAA
jgi:DNA-directed RNA polymerase subunit omega